MSTNPFSFIFKILSSKRFHTALGWGVSITLLVWISMQVEWGIVLSELVTLNYFYLIPLTFIVLIHYFIKALRWRYLLPNGDQISNSKLFETLMIGNMASSVLPLRAGEFIRPYILAKDTNSRFATTFSSIVIERFFDLVSVLVLLVGLLMFVPELPDWAMKGAFILGGLGAFILIMMLLGAFTPNLILAIVDKFLKFVPAKFAIKIRDFIANLLVGASVLRSPYRLFMTILYSVFVWVSCQAIFHVGLYMFDGEWTYLMSLTLTVIVALAVAAPSAPGFIGVYQTACVASLALFGIPKETSFAYSLILNAHQLVVVCLVGAYYMSKRHLSLKNLSETNPAVT